MSKQYVFLIVALITLVIFHHKILFVPKGTSVFSKYQTAQAIPVHDLNVCQSEPYGGTFSEQIKISYPDTIKNEDGSITIGQWDSANNVLSLMQPDGLNIQTVAHEVSHLVDTLMIRYAIQDEHYEAYLQGFWTECVYEILQEDIKNAR